MHLIHVVPTLARSAPPSQLDALQSLGHTVQAWRRSPMALAGLLRDAVIVVDGLEYPNAAKQLGLGLSRIRVKAPVLVALSPQQLPDVAADWCVDDFLVVTASPAEWERRLAWSLDRNRRAASSPVQQVGDLTLDGEAYTLTTDDRVLAVNRTEHCVLQLFFSNPEVVLSREVILAHGWDGTTYASRNVDTFICRLRQKMGPAGDVLETVRGVGYRLNPHLAAARRAA